MKILFVCLGNICRSPVAEAIAQKLIQDKGLDWNLDSAGTNGYHDGEKADPRSIKSAKSRGYDVSSISRKITNYDFKEFDAIVAMAPDNVSTLKQICPQPDFLHKIHLVTDFNPGLSNVGVPDPYYGSEKDFQTVIDILEGCLPLMIDQFKKTSQKSI